MNDIIFDYELNNGHWIKAILNLNFTHYITQFTITKDGNPYTMPEGEMEDFIEVCKNIIEIERGIH